MFIKAPAAVIAHGESIVIPLGRTEVEWECELGIVIGRMASHVPTETVINTPAAMATRRNRTAITRPRWWRRAFFSCAVLVF